MILSNMFVSNEKYRDFGETETSVRVIDFKTAKSQALSNQQVVGKLPASEGGQMYEENLILSQIEELVDQMPYKSARIEVELADKMLVLTKDRQRPIGFSVEKSN